MKRAALADWNGVRYQFQRNRLPVMVIDILHHGLQLRLPGIQPAQRRRQMVRPHILPQDLPHPQQKLYRAQFVLSPAFLESKNLSQRLQHLLLPGDLGQKNLLCEGGLQDGRNKFCVKIRILRRQQRRGKHDIRTKSASICLVAMKDAAVDKDAAPLRQLCFLLSDIAHHSTSVHHKKFQFVVPVPVDPMEIKLPDIFRIIGEMIRPVSVRDGFPQCIIRLNLINSHVLLPSR